MDRHYYRNEIMNMAASLSPQESDQFMNSFAAVEKNPVVIFGFNAWLGGLGIDRFVIGDVLLGILKLITFGGFGIWIIVDGFLIGNRTRTKNLEKARMIYDGIRRKAALS